MNDFNFKQSDCEDKDSLVRLVTEVLFTTKLDELVSNHDGECCPISKEEYLKQAKEYTSERMINHLITHPTEE
jgi:hypothetical protein